VFNDFLEFIDETIINRCFQPISDKIRTVFGWSKRVPSVVMKVVAIVGLIPACVTMVTIGGIAYLLATFMLLWILAQVLAIVTLVRDEMRNNSSQTTGSESILDKYRVSGKNDRKYALVLSVFALPFILAGILTPEFSYIASFYFVGAIANLCDGFFRACTDLPKGKSIFTRVRAWLRSFTEQATPQIS